MFEFSKLCKEFEGLSVFERGALLTGKSAGILAKLSRLSLPGVDPAQVLAGFILGAVVADGRVNEQEYLLMYPALLRVFGNDFDFDRVKKSFAGDREGKKAVKRYTREMLALLAFADERLLADVVTVCLCVVSVDNKISHREQRYIRQLCKAAD